MKTPSYANRHYTDPALAEAHRRVTAAATAKADAVRRQAALKHDAVSRWATGEIKVILGKAGIKHSEIDMLYAERKAK